MPRQRGGQSSAINVVINGEDNLSGVLRGIVAQGTAMGNIMTQVFNGIGSKLSSVANIAKSQFTNALEVQLNVIGTAGSLMGVIDSSFSQATEITKELNKEFVKMASTLPGVTQDYAMIGLAISDDVFNAIRDVDGKVDLPRAKQTLLELTEGFGLLAQQTGASAAEASQNLVRLLSGDISALKMVQFDKSPAFKNALDKVMAADGKMRQDWEKATTEQRAKWINQALKTTIPPEAIEKLKVTVDGIWQGWKSSLFDASSGLLGFLREITSRDNGTVMDAISKAFQSADKLFAKIAEINPFNFDVLVPIYDSFVWISKQIDKVTNLISQGFTIRGIAESAAKLSESIVGTIDAAISRASNGLSGILSSVASADLSALSGVVTGIGNVLVGLSSTLRTRVVGFVVSLFNGITSTISSIPLNVSSIGTAMAELLTSNVSMLVELFTSIDFSGAVSVVRNMGTILVMTVVNLANRLMDNLSNVGMGIQLGTGAEIGNMIGSTLVRVISTTIQVALKGIVAFDMTKFIQAVYSIGAFIVGFIVGALGSAIRETITSLPKIFASSGEALWSVINSIIEVFGIALGKLMGTIKSAGAGLMNWVTDIKAKITASIEEIINITANIFSNVSSAVSGAVSTVTSVAKNGIDGIISAFTSIFNNIQQTIQSITSRISSMIPTIPRLPNPFSGGNQTRTTTTTTTSTTPTSTARANTNGTNIEEEMAAYRAQHSATGNLLPLLDAIRLESRLMPANSNLTVANTSETILNRRQTAALASALTTSRRGQGNGNPVNVTININGNGLDANAIADRVIQLLNQATTI